MSKLKILFLIPFLLLFGYKIHSQHLWYENEIATENITFTGTLDGAFTINETNPDLSGINTNTISSKFVRDANVTRGFTYFELFTPLTTASKYTVTLKAYTDVATTDLSSEPNRLRVYLKNTTTGDFKQKTKTFTIGQAWEKFSFVFDKSDFTTEGLGSGGYNQMYIGYGNGQESTSTINYYIDQIHGSIPQIPLEEVLTGSWGGRFYIRAGEDLDDYADIRNYDYLAGAQEIADNYPTMGHVITNATNNANSQLWTLRTNPNVDAIMGAENSIVDEEFVPSLANEQIISDVIDIFKSGGKKVILYLNAKSPAERATETGAIAWNNYVSTYFNNDEHTAWMNYCEGYIKRFTELGVDGYWIDAFSTYPGDDTERSEFIQMIRDAAPNATITTNIDKDSFVDENGDLILVDTDGIDESVGIDGTGDDPNRDYPIVKMTATNPWSDFTAGHITPLGQGAPPNSWAYEEFTVTDIEESSMSTYNETKRALKHLFLPLRATWSNQTTDLLFNAEQAYRFAKRITDAGGSVTFSNTTATDGTTAEDEVPILTFVDQQLAINADATVYERPEGASLVGEILSTLSNKGEDLSVTIYPNPVTTSFKISREFTSVFVYTITGQKLLEFSGDQDSFDVSNLNAGIYLLRVNDSQGNSKVTKFLKK